MLESVSGEREEEFDSVVNTAEQTSEGGRARVGSLLNVTKCI